MRQCVRCHRWVDSNMQSDECPHTVKTDGLSEANKMKGRDRNEALAMQLQSAQQLLGKQVWFQPNRSRVHTVQGVSHLGMLTLDGVLGEVSAYWITVVV